MGVKKLVFDFGMHTAQDTKSYLAEGYQVVAIEANPELVAVAQKKMAKYISNKQLTILNLGVAGENGVLSFYKNLHLSEWSSFDFEIGSRDNTPYEEIKVECVTADKIFRQFDRAYYVKIDIEGFDHFVLSSLDPDNLPQYISCEDSSTENLDILYEKGYRKFKLINQARNFEAFSLSKEQNTILNYIQFKYNRLKIRVQKILPFKYPYSSSGPFGEASAGPWHDYATVKGYYQSFYQGEERIPINNLSWFDIHSAL
ncbi:MAG: FkbM family methyltransferase [Sediminibacterium sp.]